MHVWYLLGPRTIELETMCLRGTPLQFGAIMRVAQTLRPIGAIKVFNPRCMRHRVTVVV